MRKNKEERERHSFDEFALTKNFTNYIKFCFIFYNYWTSKRIKKAQRQLKQEKKKKLIL